MAARATPLLLLALAAFAPAAPDTRSAALFEQMAKVLTSPRCMNCHPADRRPRQGDDRHLHIPAVFGGPDGHGSPALSCDACHQARNTPVVGYAIRSVPGNPKWALAPPEMAWEGKTPGQICRQLKDPARNGRRTLDQLWRHMAFDDLVGWAWSPGAGRTPAPGTQAELGALARAWIDSGARCPA